MSIHAACRFVEYLTGSPQRQAKHSTLGLFILARHYSPSFKILECQRNKNQLRNAAANLLTFRDLLSGAIVIAQMAKSLVFPDRACNWIPRARVSCRVIALMTSPTFDLVHKICRAGALGCFPLVGFILTIRDHFSRIAVCAGIRMSPPQNVSGVFRIHVAISPCI